MAETELPDGRRAQLWTGGAASGPTMLVCHGTPDTRWVARSGRDAAEAVGVRLLCVNRPGYGTSTPARSTLSSVADDDRNPPATGRWWADRVPDAELHVTPTTHLATLLANWADILRMLTQDG